MIDLVFQNLTSDPPSSRLQRASKKYNSKFFEKILIACMKELKLGNSAPSLSTGRHSERGQGEGSREELPGNRLRAWSGASKNIGISVNLVGEVKIKELNKKYRKKNEVTDVLSFPMSSDLETRDKRQVRPKILVSGRLSLVSDLGDLFICLSFAKKEAKRENISIERKLAQLTVHGFLHLMGYDHEKSDKDAKKMFKLENKILSKIGDL